MSEIKAQLVGVMLVITIFTTIGGLLLKGFHDSAYNVVNSVGNELVFEEPED